MRPTAAEKVEAWSTCEHKMPWMTAIEVQLKNPLYCFLEIELNQRSDKDPGQDWIGKTKFLWTTSRVKTRSAIRNFFDSASSPWRTSLEIPAPGSWASPETPKTLEFISENRGFMKKSLNCIWFHKFQKMVYSLQCVKCFIWFLWTVSARLPGSIQFIYHGCYQGHDGRNSMIKTGMKPAPHDMSKANKKHLRFQFTILIHQISPASCTSFVWKLHWSSSWELPSQISQWELHRTKRFWKSTRRAASRRCRSANNYASIDLAAKPKWRDTEENPTKSTCNR